AVFPPHLSRKPAFLLSDSETADLEFAFSHQDACPTASAKFQRKAPLDHQAIVRAVGQFISAYGQRGIGTSAGLSDKCFPRLDRASHRVEVSGLFARESTGPARGHSARGIAIAKISWGGLR